MLNVAAAHAALAVGNAVSATYLFPTTSSVLSGPITVSGPAGSISSFANILDIAFTDTSISLTLTQNAGVNNVAFDGVEFIDLNGALHFDSFGVDQAATNYAQFTVSRLSHTPDTLFLNIVGLPGLSGQKIVLAVNPIPVPAAIWLLGSALGGLGYIRRHFA